MEHNFFKRIYTARELYKAIYCALRTTKYMRKSRNNGEMNSEFTERIMLAVTEVNGCEVCSYVHTKIALEKGMSTDEIQSLLSGNAQTVPEEETYAILFAQHYADTRANPSLNAWNRIIDVYGQTKALGILGAVRMMMMANIYGIAISALRRRLKGAPVKKSSLLYEIGMLLSILIYLPTAAVHGIISNITRKPLIKF